MHGTCHGDTPQHWRGYHFIFHVFLYIYIIWGWLGHLFRPHGGGRTTPVAHGVVQPSPRAKVRKKKLGFGPLGVTEPRPDRPVWRWPSHLLAKMGVTSHPHVAQRGWLTILYIYDSHVSAEVCLGDRCRAYMPTPVGWRGWTLVLDGKMDGDIIFVFFHTTGIILW